MAPQAVGDHTLDDCRPGNGDHGDADSVNKEEDFGRLVIADEIEQTVCKSVQYHSPEEYAAPIYLLPKAPDKESPGQHSAGHVRFYHSIGAEVKLQHFPNKYRRSNHGWPHDEKVVYCVSLISFYENVF